MKTTLRGPAALGLVFLFAAWAVLSACEGDNGDSSAASASPSGTPKPSASITADVILSEFEDVNGATNSVRLLNTDNNRFLAKANMRLDKTRNDLVDPRNEAVAEARCTDCQTIAVALQVVVYQRGAHTVSPQNIAIALNANCTRCVTVALAYQYVIPVDNYKEVPQDVRDLLKDMEKELRYFEQVRSINEIDVNEAERRLTAVIDKWGQLKQFLATKRAESRAQNTEASPSPSASAGASVDPSATPSTGSAAPAPSASPSGAP